MSAGSTRRRGYFEVVLLSAALALTTTIPVLGETITAATYNIELFNLRFLAHRLTGDSPDALPKDLQQQPQIKSLLDDERKQNDKANWAASTVILDPQFSPDILALEECCDEGDLKYFNHRWLDDAYATVIAFQTNTTRHQSVALLLKKGFTVEDRKDQYYLEKDPGKNVRGDRLFARGPAFLKIKTPGGYEMWVGVTHQKSKKVEPGEGEDKDAASVGNAAWRLREATRTHQIMKELMSAGPANLMLLGDMNDELGEDENEKKAGGDAVAILAGPEQDGLVLADRKLAESKAFSYGGYWSPRFRTMIDHIIVSNSIAPHVEDVQIFKSGLAPVASDHFPVLIRFTTSDK